MAEGMAEAYPQIFVVDSQASYAPLPSERHPRWRGIRRRLLPLLVGLALFGVAIEACLIYYLFHRTGDLPGTQTSFQRGGSYSAVQTGSEEDNSIREGGPRRKTTPSEAAVRPSAHLIASHRLSNDSVLQWETDKNDAFVNQMGYSRGCLVVQQEGYYYIYSQVHFLEACVFKHMVMKQTKRYGNQPLELMKAHRQSHCSPQDPSMHQGLFTSYQGGVFHLETDDAIFVTVEDKKSLRTLDNFFGVFMI